MHGYLHMVVTSGRHGLTMIEDQHYEIVDIGLHMLAPRQLYCVPR